MSRRIAKILNTINLIAMIVLMLVFINQREVMFLCALAGLIIAGVLRFFLRCPHCGALPWKGSMLHEYCPHCGEPLDD